MNSLKKIILLLFIASYASLSAQDATEADDQLSLENGTIDNQFEYVIQRSNNYQDYKVVKKNWLYTLKAHTLDSLKSIHSELATAEGTISNQNSEIASLKSSLKNTEDTLNKTTSEKNNMELFGLQMTKPNYNILMWSIVALLLALLLLFIYKFKNSNTITREAQKNLSETEDEFDEHRRTALEREQKVRRQLQDELNKQKGIN
ncbi:MULTISPECIES: tRNA (guanine-N1)-methyltransferase [Bizionia]|uniref:tRNA (Guanine-N1)-methyltransferase n=1 Tax=Bizionia algoritergicola TaxID=291187 RepID=A0A5D0QTA8_9FLAO|nr:MULTISPECIES: tRNA (guanine-N1)-methyltransferase [Bizionia]OBX22764.1 tRNA (guanine-N1)-methyltransferase [Bizionia sp. APA-3]TYB72463.1 tRNA (guanine-N1)-methyltransferase [Bizionia algoritergicola]